MSWEGCRCNDVCDSLREALNDCHECEELCTLYAPTREHATCHAIAIIKVSHGRKAGFTNHATIQDIHNTPCMSQYHTSNDQPLTTPSSPTSPPTHVHSAKPTSPGTSANTTADAAATSSAPRTSPTLSPSTRTPATTPTAPKAKPATPASVPGGLSRNSATRARPASPSQ
jgi:hypothetical protein